jgi:hypothetical protein
VSWLTPSGDGIIDIVITEMPKYSSEYLGGSTFHRLYSNGAWSEWEMMLASHEGYEYFDTQSILLGDPSGADGKPNAHLVSRGTDDCIHYTSFDGTQWDSWTYLWCASMGGSYDTKYMPLFAIAGKTPGTGHVLARTLEGTIMRYQIDGVVEETIENGVPSASWEDLGRAEGAGSV